ncbi:hypothetical protein C0Q70_08185 [Pomacea canaliculata]|uniref:ADF-H domain-containing protein n=1 Tax=Pomacea canaliculata TaxID=400727 RepID=A0A2T7PH76_POMCA|nr:hypothetical protein C0Q70_08185 [Pomacea canaliculata]
MSTASESTREEPSHFMEVISGLPQDDGRYVVYDYPYTESYGDTSKLIFILCLMELATTAIANKKAKLELFAQAE